MPNNEGGQHRKSYRIRAIARDRLEKLAKRLRVTQRKAIIMAIEKAASKRRAAKPGVEKREMTTQYLPHDTCMQLARLAATDASSETEAFERAVYELAKDLRLCE